MWHPDISTYLIYKICNMVCTDYTEHFGNVIYVKKKCYFSKTGWDCNRPPSEDEFWIVIVVIRFTTETNK